MAQQGIEYEISNGPSKFDIMLALFDISHHRPQRFTLVFPTRDIQVVITEVGQMIDLAAERWFFKGWVKDLEDVSVGFDSNQSYLVEGYFSTKTREGRIKIN